MTGDDYLTQPCGRVCPNNRLVSCVLDPDHDGLCKAMNPINGTTYGWLKQPPVLAAESPADWEELGWFGPPEPFPTLRDVEASARIRSLGIMVSVLVGVLVVMVVVLAVAVWAGAS